MLACPSCQSILPPESEKCPKCGEPASGAAAPLARGIALFAELRYVAALKEFERALQIAPQSAQVLRCLAHGLYHTGQTESAAKQYRALLEKNPDDPEARYNLGQILVNQGRLDQARAIFEALSESRVEIEPDRFYLGLFFRKPEHFRADCLYYLAIVSWNLGDTEGALADFERALQLNPEHAPASRHLGNLLLRGQDHAAAIEHYRRFIQLHQAGVKTDDLLEVRLNLGIAEIELGHFEEALEALNEVLRERPGHPGAIYHMNLIYQREGRYTPTEWGPAAMIAHSEGASTIFGLSKRGESRDSAARAGLAEDRPIIGKSLAMQRVLRYARLAAASDATVLVTGENGTGKELIARAIHINSSRRDRIFLPVNCAAIPETLVESELFGYEKGAFTGANERKLGRFEAGHTGTIFLDEIGELDLNMQVKLLRFLQEREFTRVGGNETMTVDVRIIAATNQNLEDLLARGLFRQDLYYRLNVLPIHVPPLRERPEDIPLLVDHFIYKFGKGSVRKETLISQDDLRVLTEYQWPGNIRELENVVERASVLGTQIVPIIQGIADRRRRDQPHSDPLGRREGAGEPGLQPRVLQAPRREDEAEFEPATLRDLERRHIERVLEFTRGHPPEAARLLDISLSTLWRKIREYEIPYPERARRERKKTPPRLAAGS